MIRDHIYKYEHIVIGNGLNALIYAYKTGGIFINNTMVRIFSYDTIDHPINLDVVQYDAKDYQINVYENLSHKMAMEGRDFLGRDVESISVKLNENELSVSSKYFRPKKFRFSTLTVFDTENVIGLPFDEPNVEDYRVFDWFNVRSGTKHEFDYLNSDSNFVKKIHFYLSPRIDGNKCLKDLVAESLLSKEQLYNINYSDSLARLKVLSMMRKADIKGSGNGVGKHLSLKIELTEREVFPIKEYSKEQEGDVILSNCHYSEV